MSGLAAVLAGRTPGGVFPWHSDLSVRGFETVAGAAGWGTAHLAGASVRTREEFLEAVGRAFGFAETYGRNFDALADALRDVAPKPCGAGTVLLWDDCSVFAAHDPRWYEVALDVLAERAEESALPRFVVLLRDTAEQPPR